MTPAAAMSRSESPCRMRSRACRSDASRISCAPSLALRAKAQRVETAALRSRRPSRSACWLLYADPAPAPTCRSRSGCNMPVRHWLLYGDHRLAPICRSVTRGCVRTCPHAQRLHRQPYRVDSDHLSSSRNHTAQSAAHPFGQLIDTVVGPRLSSMRISGKVVSRSACGIASAMNAAVVDEAGAGCISLQHLCTRLVFRPLAIATWATDAPGSAQAATTGAFKSTACRLRVEGLVLARCPQVLRGHHPFSSQGVVDGIAGRVRVLPLALGIRHRSGLAAAFERAKDRGVPSDRFVGFHVRLSVHHTLFPAA